MKPNPIRQDSISHAVIAGDSDSERINRLDLARRRGSSLINHSLDIHAVVDREGKLQFVNPAMGDVLGHSDADIMGKNFSQHIHEADRASADAAMEKVIARVSKLKRNWRLIDASGRVRLFEVTLRNLLLDPDVDGILVTLHDVTEQHKLEQKLVHQAFYDVLTGLPNRALFFDRARTALKRAKRSQSTIGLLYIDIDDFKRINDQFGHAEGDRVLVEMAARLTACVRACDTIARMGGDEFTVLIENCGTAGDLSNIVAAIQAKLRLPMKLAEESIGIRASIGAAISSNDSSPDSLLSQADAAMYVSKGSQAIVAAFRRSRRPKFAE